ncbi:hypothetical protein [Actinomyces sp.]|uniref:hypothetical protein n=1 Tax=Actinomyces sp. TaxID=29317 RepID=UPI0026DD02E8|nr:hypothetical protein [Actinomyces sp.]MDO4655699.1 hypothetical protein [Actinomyces sp.]
MSPTHRSDLHRGVTHSPESSTQSTSRSTSTAYPAGSGATAALVVTALLVLTQLYAAIPLLTPISTDLHGNATVALSTAFSLTYAAGFLIWGRSPTTTAGGGPWRSRWGPSPSPPSAAPWRRRSQSSRPCARSRG